ncbi:MAG TPA: cache domain-containing protein [Candidatus Paceibacterota bacterium]|nr:cache domain-containing protein [Candidatus Paceibacterota bacterium]
MHERSVPRHHRLLGRLRATLARRPVAVACFIILVGFAASDRASVIVAETFEHRAHGDTVNALSQYLKDEQAALLAEARSLATVPEIRSALAARDSFRLIELSQEEVARGKIGMLLTTDANGVALARTRSIGHRGDYVFDRTAWGRAVGDGAEIAVIDHGITHPLLMIAGVPVRADDGVMVGAVFPAHRMDDVFARTLRDAHLPPGSEVAFFLSDRGVVGDSFSTEEQRHLAEVFLNPAQIGEIESVARATHDAMWDIGVGADRYTVVPLLFSGYQDAPGGALVFLPTCHTCWAAGVAAFFALFVASFGILALWWIGARGDRMRHGALTLLGLGLLGALAIGALSLFRMESGVLRISEPRFSIYNSTMRFDPDTDIVDPSFEQRVAIMVATGGETINAVDTVVGYDPDAVIIEDVLTTSSFCDRGFFTESEIDPQRGEVRISCGVPSPAFSASEGIVAELVLRPKRSGSYTLRFLPDTQVLANDGLGTDVLRQTTDATYHVLDRSASSTAPRGIVFSYSHPNSSRWYRSRTVHFSWLREAGHAYQYAIDQSVLTIPVDGTQTTAAGTSLFVPEDGEYYFHLLDRSSGRADVVSHFRVRIDGTPPPAPTIALSNDRPRVGETVRFEFSSRESSEGLRRWFYMRIGEGGMFVPIEKSFVIPFLRAGTYVVTVRSFDLAGNWSDATKTVIVSP